MRPINLSPAGKANPFRHAAILAVGMFGMGSWAGAQGDTSKVAGEWEISVKGSEPVISPAKDVEGEDTEKEGGAEAVKPAKTPVARFRATLLEVGGDSIRAVSAISQQATDIAFSDLVSIRRIPPGDNSPAAKVPPSSTEISGAGGDSGFRVGLRGGGEIGGILAAFEKENITIESESFGTVKIPIAAVKWMARNKPEFLKPGHRPRQTESRVVLETGEVFHGELGAESKGDQSWISITGKNVSAHFPLYLTGRIDFPKSIDPVGGDAAEGAKWMLEVKLNNGSRHFCERIGIRGSKLLLSLPEKIELLIPDEMVASFLPVKTENLIRGDQALFWGGFAESGGDHLANTIASVRESTIPFEQVVEMVPGEDFRKRLFRSKALVITRMDTFESDKKVEVSGEETDVGTIYTAEIAPLLVEYLGAGGHILFTGISNSSVSFMESVGLGKLEIKGEVNGGRQGFPIASQKLLDMERGTAVITLPPKVTRFVKPGGWELIAGSEKLAVAITKKVGRGRLTCLGSDFSKTTMELDLLFGRLLRLRD